MTYDDKDGGGSQSREADLMTRRGGGGRAWNGHAACFGRWRADVRGRVKRRAGVVDVVDDEHEHTTKGEREEVLKSGLLLSRRRPKEKGKK